MWVQNTSLKSVITGQHRFEEDNTILIQIVDPAWSFPRPFHKFTQIYQFEFLDIDFVHPAYDEAIITLEQAEQLVEILQHALDNKLNVVVHCHAGLCRSGAVCEVGVMMGFEDTGVERMPNVLVKKLMMQVLGFGYY